MRCAIKNISSILEKQNVIVIFNLHESHSSLRTDHIQHYKEHIDTVVKTTTRPENVDYTTDRLG